jgi:hypothetical protein
MRQGSLLEYEPGELLIVDHRILDKPSIQVAVPPPVPTFSEWIAGAPPAPRTDPHVFEARPFKGEPGCVNAGQTAWGYYVDANA